MVMRPRTSCQRTCRRGYELPWSIGAWVEGTGHPYRKTGDKWFTHGGSGRSNQVSKYINDNGSQVSHCLRRGL